MKYHQLKFITNQELLLLHQSLHNQETVSDKCSHMCLSAFSYIKKIMVKEMLYFKMNVGMPNDLKLAGGVCVCFDLHTIRYYDCPSTKKVPNN